MTTYTLVADCNIDQLGTTPPSGSSSARAGGDIIDTNGFNFTIDQDSRYGLTGTTSTSFAGMTINASKGGNITIDGRNVRLIPYNSGSGNVPAWNTSITQGGASGKLIAVYSSLTSAPTATGAAMPASGYIKVKGWNGTAYGSGALTGIGATATGADVAGWIEVVADESATVTANRLGTFAAYGAWYEFLGVTTDGTRATTYQIPTNGSLTYVAGVWVQSASASITAASYSAGSITYTAAGHGFSVGQDVTITGATSGYNCADSVITSKTADTFTVAASDPGGSWTSGGSAYVYEFYPNAGSRSALVAQIQTDAVRGKWCWISTGGLVRFGHDGTNSTGGYIVPSGRKLRVPNVFLQNCTTAARTVNALPNATLGTRYDFTTTGGGAVVMDKVCCGWYLSLAQAYSVNLKYVATFEAMTISETASALTMWDVGVGQTGTANTQIGLTFSLMFAGGTIRNCTISRIAQAASGAYVESWADMTGFTVTNHKTFSLTKAANATTGAITMTRILASTFEDCQSIGAGRYLLIGCNYVTFSKTTYADNLATTTGTSIPMYAWDIGTAACYNMKFDGLSWGGLDLVQPYSGVLNVGVAGCQNIKLRNLGTAASPLDMGGSYVSATWTRSTTTMTITKTAHGLKAGDLIAVNMCSDASSLLGGVLTTTTATLKSVASVTDANTFTHTCANAGQTTGQNMRYHPCMAGVLVNFTAGAAANGVYIQRCYTPHLRTGILGSVDNSSKNIVLEDVWGTDWGVQLMPQLNGFTRGMQSTPALTAQTSCYGTHFADYYTTANLGPTSSASWSRSTTTCTVTSNDHGLRVGDQVLVTVTSDSAAVVLGVKTLTQITASASPVNVGNTFQFTCLNAGSASGTLSFTPLNGRVAIQMNEPTDDTANQVALTGGAAFTSAGTLYMPTIGQSATFTADKAIRGHGSFPIAEAVMAGGTIGNYDIAYSLDDGVTWRNLYYPRAGGGGSNGSTNVTMTSTTGVQVGDYVWGTNIAPNAKVTSITNSTTVVVDTANIGTVSGTLRFNHLPSETVADATVGFDLKVKITTSTTNTTAISSLYFFTNSNSTHRAATYPLDLATVSLSNIVSGSDTVILASNSTTVIASTDADAGTTFTATIDPNEYPSIDVCVYQSGYTPYIIRNLALTDAGLSLPMNQAVDPSYVP